MAVARNSRFYNTPTYQVTRADGVLVTVYQRRKLLNTQINKTVQTKDYTRIDILAYDNYNDSTKWWAISDVSIYDNPFEVTATPGEDIIIPDSGEIKQYTS